MEIYPTILQEHSTPNYVSIANPQNVSVPASGSASATLQTSSMPFNGTVIVVVNGLSTSVTGSLLLNNIAFPLNNGVNQFPGVLAGTTIAISFSNSGTSAVTVTVYATAQG